jgi:hypothetical protein
VGDVSSECYNGLIWIAEQLASHKLAMDGIASLPDCAIGLAILRLSGRPPPFE